MNPDLYDLIIFRGAGAPATSSEWVNLHDSSTQTVGAATPALAEFVEKTPGVLRGFEHLLSDLLGWHETYREELVKLGIDPDASHVEKQVMLQRLPERYHEIVRLWDMKLDVTSRLLKGLEPWREQIDDFLHEYGGVPARCKGGAA